MARKVTREDAELYGCQQQESLGVAASHMPIGSSADSNHQNLRGNRRRIGETFFRADRNRMTDPQKHRESRKGITPDGNRALSASHDKTLRVWDLETGKSIAVYPLESGGMSVAVAAENRIIAGTASGQLHFLTLKNCSS